MGNSFRTTSQKLIIGVFAVSLAVSATSCSKGKKSAEPSTSASASVSASASPSASKTVAKPTAKPTVSEQAPAPIKPTATKPYTQTVPPKPPIKLDSKEQVFAKEFTRLTKLNPDSWDLKVDGDPLTYKRYYKEMLSYAKGALCAYIATGLDDFTLGTYIANEVTYDTDIQTALLAATRKAYGCKAS